VGLRIQSISRARVTVVWSEMAPAASVGPSVPSVPPLRRTIFSRPADVQGPGQGKFLISSSQSVASNGHRRLASRDNAGRFLNGVIPRDHLSGNRCVEPGGLSCVANNGRRQDEGVEPSRGGFLRSRKKSQGIGPDQKIMNLSEGLVSRFWRLFDSFLPACHEMFLNGRRQFRPQTIFFEDLPRFFKTGGVGNGRAGCDYLEWISYYVGKDETEHRGRISPTGQASPFYSEICFLTVLISLISAPQLRRSWVTSCFSSSVIPSAGHGRRADPPPDKRKMTRS